MSCLSKQIVVIGLGNPLVEDEGIGQAVLQKLENNYACTDLDMVDLGTNAFSIIHALQNRKTAVIIDCAFMGLDAGEIRKFGPDEVKSGKELLHASLHEADILGILDIYKRITDSPAGIIIFGIQPSSLRQGLPLSTLLESRLVGYAETVARELGLAEKTVV
ncbi:MAG: hydrogenase maturation protease [Spirochaetaceae bacterium]|nr:MAG: hydrogenase maturation protease [Spirochaetaceae bacterium]